MKPWMVISFHTPDKIYVDHAIGLRNSLQAFKIAYDIEQLASQGDWQINAKMKPNFILRKLDQYPGYNIVWIDIDGRVRRYPILFDTLDADIAAHWRLRKCPLAGTMYFRNSPISRDLLRTWIEETIKPIRDPYGDQSSLKNVLQNNPGRWKIVDLPAPYTLIFDTMRKQGPPVIEHLQASRQAHKKEKEKT